MEVTKITLEDNGQDFLELYVSAAGDIIDAKPFQSEIWKGGYIPIDDSSMVYVGNYCPIHHPPHIVFGWLNHKIEKIEKVEITNE